MLMMEEKPESCDHTSYIYHAVDSSFDNFELQSAFKRRIDVEPLLPSLLLTSLLMHTQEAPATAGIGVS